MENQARIPYHRLDSLISIIFKVVSRVVNFFSSARIMNVVGRNDNTRLLHCRQLVQLVLDLNLQGTVGHVGALLCRQTCEDDTTVMT